MGHVADSELALQLTLALLEAKLDDGVSAVHGGFGGDAVLGVGVEGDEGIVVSPDSTDLHTPEKAENPSVIAHEDEEVAEIVKDEAATITQLFCGLVNDVHQLFQVKGGEGIFEVLFAEACQKVRVAPGEPLQEEEGLPQVGGDFPAEGFHGFDHGLALGLGEKADAGLLALESFPEELFGEDAFS